MPTGALTNVLIRGDFHLKEIPFDHSKIGIFAKEKIFSIFLAISSGPIVITKKIRIFLLEILSVKNDVIKIMRNFCPGLGYNVRFKSVFLIFLQIFRGWGEFEAF